MAIINTQLAGKLSESLGAVILVQTKNEIIVSESMEHTDVYTSIHIKKRNSNIRVAGTHKCMHFGLYGKDETVLSERVKHTYLEFDKYKKENYPRSVLTLHVRLQWPQIKSLH